MPLPLGGFQSAMQAPRVLGALPLRQHRQQVLHLPSSPPARPVPQSSAVQPCTHALCIHPYVAATSMHASASTPCRRSTWCRFHLHPTKIQHQQNTSADILDTLTQEVKDVFTPPSHPATQSPRCVHTSHPATQPPSHPATNRPTNQPTN
jgi:hypothetical protein